MNRRHLIVSALLVSFGGFGVVSCSGPSDESVIGEFFTASRENDRAAIRRVATVTFDPETRGALTEFTVVSTSEERREALPTQALRQAVADAEAADAAFTEQKLEYQDANMAAIQRVLKADAGNVTLDGDDGEVQREWMTFREQTAEHAKAVSDARARLDDAVRLIELSASTPRIPVSGVEAAGQIVTKDVTISAPVTMADGQTVQKTLVVTLQRALIEGESEIEGRWIVTAVNES